MWTKKSLTNRLGYPIENLEKNLKAKLIKLNV